MSLPQLVLQKHNITLPISNLELVVTPYLTKHERLLLKAKESKDTEEIISVITQILEDCTDNYDVKKLPMADIQFLLLKLKAFSSGEIVELNMRCQNKLPSTEEGGDTVKCGHKTLIEIDLNTEVQYDTDGIADSHIELGDGIGIVMQPPSFKIFKTILMAPDSKADQLFTILADCIEYIWDKDEKYSDWTEEEIQGFIDSLSNKHMETVKNYLESIPSMLVKKDFKCESCGYTEEIVLDDIFDFFT
jgi:hypothetical protein